MKVSVSVYAWICVFFIHLCVSLDPSLYSSRLHVHLYISLPVCVYFHVSVCAGAFTHACVALHSIARCIFPRQPWRREMSFNMPSFLPQSILMLIYQTWSLPCHTTPPMFSGPWGAISGVEPSSAHSKGGNRKKKKTCIHKAQSHDDFFS